MSNQATFGQNWKKNTYASKMANRRQEYDDINVDPYANRTIRKGARQESAEDIRLHGERSDTNWDKVMKQNLKQLKDQYYGGSGKYDPGWTPVKSMDKTSAALYKAHFGGGSTLAYRTKRPGTELSEKQRDQGYTVASQEAWDENTASIAEFKETATAEYMSIYNKNLNTAEHIKMSESRQAHRAKFTQMEINKDRKQRKQQRGSVRRGTSTLQVGGSMTGLGI